MVFARAGQRMIRKSLVVRLEAVFPREKMENNCVLLSRRVHSYWRALTMFSKKTSTFFHSSHAIRPISFNTFLSFKQNGFEGCWLTKPRYQKTHMTRSLPELGSDKPSLCVTHPTRNTVYTRLLTCTVTGGGKSTRFAWRSGRNLAI